MRSLNLNEVAVVSGGDGGDDPSTACGLIGGLAGVATGLVVTGAAAIASILTAGLTLPGAAALGAVSGVAVGAGARLACLAAFDDLADSDDDDDDDDGE